MPLTMKSFWFLESNERSNLPIFGSLQSAGDTPEVKNIGWGCSKELG